MNYPHVRLHIAENSAITWTDDYSRLETADLEHLLQQCRHSVASLEAELTRRNVPTYSISTGKADKCFEAMERLVLRVKLTGRLDNKAVENVHVAMQALQNTTTDLKTQSYQRFIFDILRLYGRDLFLACVGSLGKHKVANMNDDDRLGLLYLLKAKGQRLKVDELLQFAVEYQVPFFDDPRLAHLAHLHRKRTWDEGPRNAASDTAKSTSDSKHQIAQPMTFIPKGYSTSALLPLNETGAEVILKATKEDRNALKITLPSPHESLPYMIIPHQICANIMRKYTGHTETT
ncbi:hypothetical protein KXV70_004900 [Aspergillus fumigatus]|nr:hypothetical protein KXX44_004103 [Aspergillus fumigatus]KAH2221185.1 hypothetical protein KXW71_002113 [Aspergillus fumigatus]KAH2301927.1 hypothetical protein KXV47_001675 [Aspergillus fumigatus]KAH2362900.1 hypothetical protein KXV98_004561 [Aspergillus fumigatus]KAH2568147.1 hypothetical protein KXV70_004900 [Aspergillus fumigatus]